MVAPKQPENYADLLRIEITNSKDLHNHITALLADEELCNILGTGLYSRLSNILKTTSSKLKEHIGEKILELDYVLQKIN